ncbi:MAG TPA: methionyl-tRNA formyltransferase [Sphingobacteriaceae bacterium]|nr:methionyl-tRNA formyltransferase [Sphingobacteriaceae bacterium]
MRIIFMGTPDFAVASLEALLAAGENVVAVVTAPDRPAGRGQKISQSAVKECALRHEIPVLQPEKLKDPEFIEALRTFRADLQVVVAFRMLPEVVWNMPPMGTVNLHASLLPQYRGAAPINHAIMNGAQKSGVTTFLLQHEIDTGHILLAKEVGIDPEDTAGDLHDKLMHVGAALLVQTVQAMKAGTITPKPQDLSRIGTLHEAPKIFKEDAEIDWEQSIERIHNHIRGLSPYPAAYTYLKGKLFKIFRSKKIAAAEGNVLPQPGSPESDGKTYLRFAASDGYIEAIEIQAEGKKKMPIADFLRGYSWSD